MVLDKLLSILSEYANVEESEITLTTKLIDDLGLDSLDMGQIIMSLEDEFEIEIDNDTAESIETVGDAVSAITSLLEE